MKKKTELLIIIALCSLATIGFSDSINVTCLADIYAAFPSASNFLKSYIVSGPSLVAIPFILAMGTLSEKIPTKKLIVIWSVIFAVSGLGCMLSQNMVQYAIARTGIGVSTSVTAALGFGLMFQIFPDPAKSAKVMGAYQTSNMVYGALLSLAAGYLCLVSWKAAMALYLTSIVTVLLLAFCIPNKIEAGSAENGEAQGNSEPSGPKTVDTKRVVIAMLEGALFHVFGFVFYYFEAVYIAERAIGTSSLSGFISSILTISGAVAGVIFAKVFGKMQRYTGVSCMVLVALSSIVLGFDVPVPVVIVAGFIFGLGAGTLSAFYPMAVNEAVPVEKATFFQSLYNCVSFGALSLVSFVPTVSMALVGGGYQRAMTFTGIAIAVLCVIFGLTIKFVIKPQKAN